MRNLTYLNWAALHPRVRTRLLRLWVIFVFGSGVVVVKLAGTDDIQAAVLLHPGPITEDEIKEVKCPISILGAEIDRASPPEQLKQFGEILSAKPGIDSFVKIFPGVSHGWSVRYDLGDESAIKSAEESHGDMLSWFKKYVK
ncbi:hydrolase tropI-like [Camellia sinensis]|uniref:Dienelactone hydrolase domain-containing protein n=1 Tax=Camellia sinensis var. sinensis TaxID=542762 RepID=A0A4S4EQN6_CAMSN|nr:hydrolase tropI-like [Camellia sinensis]THG19083.1 hypothetical protein TEA_027649 [Camellia sinensis var. sinensis]